MPYAPVRVPSIALGILQAVLEKDGFSVASLCANIRFAAEIGVRDYSRLWMILRSENAIAEWTFSHIAFPGHADNPDEFLNLLDDRNCNFVDLPDPVGRLLTVRETASRFVNEIVDHVLTLSPKILGCTSTFFQHVSSLAFLRRIREADPSVITLMGGANCETIMGMTTHKMFDWVDYVVSGEAEDIISELCGKALVWGRNVPSEELPFGVFGHIHRTTGYPTIQQEGIDKFPRAITKNLSQQPIPNYDDYMKALDQTPSVSDETKPGILVEASRGCWWHRNGGCSFCGLNGTGKKFRRKTPQSVLHELSVLRDRYGINRFEMVDNVLDPGFLDTLIPELTKIGAPYDIFFEIRPGMNRSQFEELRDAGVIWVQPGIESLHSGILKLMNKGSECWQNIQILKWVSQFGIRCSWILMYGLPGEEDAWYEEMADYLPVLFHLQAPRSLTRVRFVRYSHYHRDPDKYGLKLSPARPFFLVYPIPASELSNLVYYFDEEEQLRQQLSPVISQYLITPGLLQVKKIQQDWTRLQDSDSPPALIMQERGQHLLITDTRPISKNRELLLKGLEKDVYIACDEAPLEEEVLKMFQQKGSDPEKVKDILARHVDNFIMIHVDGRFISLALRHPAPPLRPFVDFPGGALVPRDSAHSDS